MILIEAMATITTKQIIISFLFALTFTNKKGIAYCTFITKKTCPHVHIFFISLAAKIYCAILMRKGATNRVIPMEAAPATNYWKRWHNN